MSETQSCKIIVVNDEAAERDSLDALLSAKGFMRDPYENAETFLDAHDAADAAIILMDCSLDEVSGLEAIRHVREAGDTRPIVMITAHGDIELAVNAMRAGASDFIEKPWDTEAFFQAINRVAESATFAARQAETRKHALAAIESFTPRER